MTEYERIKSAVLDAVSDLKEHAPYDTGNLKASVKVERLANTFVIYVDIGNEDTRAKRAKGEAPYMKYTNEPWSTFNPPLYGRQNPNEGWWDRSAERFAFIVAEKLKGVLM